MSEVKVRRWMFNDEHMDQKCLVLEGYIEGMPHLTKRVSIDTAALASGARDLALVKAKLIADVEEYQARWNAVQQALTQL